MKIGSRTNQNFRVLCILGALALSACNTVPAGDDPDGFDSRDPIKPVNETVFAVNTRFDKYLLKPVAHTYHYVPEWGRTGVDNFLTNLNEPANMVHGVLQFDPDMFFTSFSRFALNTTVGVLGFRDVATNDGLKYQDQNFDKTLGKYKIGEGFYTVIPILGPSTARGTVGQVADWVLDPVGFFFTTPESIAQGVTQGISERDDKDALIDQLYYKSIDPYAATRAIYLQHNGYLENSEPK